jgi:RimJ/RimL family protein N-acetyltransferase
LLSKRGRQARAGYNYRSRRQDCWEMKMALRRAAPPDVPTLARLHVDSWRAAYRDIVPASFLERFTYAARRQAFHAGLEERSEETYLVERDGEALGLLTLGPCRDDDLDQRTTGEIWGIYLQPSHWRQGAGRFACHEAECLLRSRGCATVVLWVLAANRAARRFYEAMGFAADGAAKEIRIGAPLQAVRYRKSLAEGETGPARPS